MKDLIPPEALESHIGILGKTGSGKSNLAKVLAERLMHASQRVCAIDPTGTFWGLRLSPDGKKPSLFSPVIFGGEHGDIPISEQHGTVLGEAIGTSADSAIIDTQQMRVGERVRFATDFAEALLRANRGPLHLIIDEAHLFAPQGKVNDPQSGKMLGAFNNLISLGRGRGLRIILISQRPAKLAKDSLTQIETLIAMRLIAPQDRNAVKDWVGEWADPDKGKEIIASLPSLARGDAWVWAPQLNYLERKHFPLAATFDSGTAEANASSRELPTIDLAKIGEKMDTIRQEAQANDPKKLRAEVERLKKLAAEPQTITHTIKDHTDEEMAAEYSRGRMEGYDHGVAQGQVHGLQTAADKLKELATWFASEAERYREETARLAKRTPTPPSTPLANLHKTANPPENVANSGHVAAQRHVIQPESMSPSSVKLVDAIVAAYPIGMSLETAAKRAGLSKRSSAFRRYLQEAAASPRIQKREDGRYVAVAAKPSSAATSVLDDFKRSLPPSYARMLEVLENAPGLDHSKDEIADASGVSRTSSGLSAGLKELVALGLAETTGDLYRLSQDFV